MLICSTWQLSVNTSVTLPISYGLALTKHVHAQAGIEFGQQEAMPSSTFCGFLGRGQTAEGFVTFYPDEVYTLSLSGLQIATSQKIADFQLSKQFEFLGATFDVSDRTDTKTTYEALYHQYVASEPEPTRQFSLSFQSPTSFSQQRTYLPLPVPTLLFRSWLERWNHFSSIYLGRQDLIGYVENSVVLSRHRIQSNPFSVHKSNITGFTGNIRLNVLHRSDPVLAQVLNLLVHYAQFSGTGIKTRLGMGNTELLLRKNN